MHNSFWVNIWVNGLYSFWCFCSIQSIYIELDINVKAYFIGTECVFLSRININMSLNYFSFRNDTVTHLLMLNFYAYIYVKCWCWPLTHILTWNCDTYADLELWHICWCGTVTHMLMWSCDAYGYLKLWDICWYGTATQMLIWNCGTYGDVELWHICWYGTVTHMQMSNCETYDDVELWDICWCRTVTHKCFIPFFKLYLKFNLLTLLKIISHNKKELRGGGRHEKVLNETQKT